MRTKNIIYFLLAYGWNLYILLNIFCRARDAIIILFYLLVINGQKLCLRLSYRDKHLSACASTTKSLSCLDGFQRLIIHNNVIWVCVQAWETRMCYWCSMTVVWFVQFCRHKIKSFLGIKPICFKNVDPSEKQTFWKTAV